MTEQERCPAPAPRSSFAGLSATIWIALAVQAGLLIGWGYTMTERVSQQAEEHKEFGRRLSAFEAETRQIAINTQRLDTIEIERTIERSQSKIDGDRLIRVESMLQAHTRGSQPLTADDLNMNNYPGPSTPIR